MIPTMGNTHNPERFYGAAIGELLVRLAAGPNRPLVTETSELQAPRFSTEANPEDLLPNFGDVYSQIDWTGGEGLLHRFRHRGTDADPTRFWDSQGIDVSPTVAGNPEEVRLLHRTETLDEITGTVRIARAGQTLWATSGETLRKTTELLASSPGFADDDPHASETPTDAEDIATLGDVPYVALGENGIHRDTGSWSHWSDVEAVRVWSVLDRIVASTGESLYEADAGAGSELLYTLPEGDVWTDVVDAGEAILASASNGFVYTFTLNDTAELEVAAQTRIPGEVPVALASPYPGLVFIGTLDGETSRLWSARGPTLDDRQLIRQWDGTVGRMSGNRDRVLIGVDEGSKTYIWRLELSTSGLSRGHQVASGNVDGLLSIDGLVIAGVNDEGVLRESDALVNEGWLMGPMADFFRADAKSWVSFWADVQASQGESVTLWLTTDRRGMSDPDHDSWRRIRTFQTSSMGVERSMGRNIVARALAYMVRLTPSPSNTSPTVRAVALRAYPGPGDVIVQLPVDVGDQVERPGRRRMMVPGYGAEILDALRDIEGQAALVRVFRTGEMVRGFVERVATPVPSMAPRGSVSQIALVTVRGRRADAVTSIDVGEFGAWGMFQWGAGAWGGQLLDPADTP